MFWKRRQPRMPGRPTDDQAMTLLRGKLEELAPGFTRDCVVKNGMLLDLGVGWSVMVLPNHTDSPVHFDLGFSSGFKKPLIADCISGIGEGRAAFDSLLHIWAETSGACFLEMTAGEGYATHLTEGPAALPGWHTISSGVIGYGVDDATNDALQAAMLDSDLLGVLGEDISADFDRPELNGIKAYLCRTPTVTVAEIRINGHAARRASDAMARLPWPEVTETSIARFYAVAVHPA
jgi:hypothetical protein